MKMDVTMSHDELILGSDPEVWPHVGPGSSLRNGEEMRLKSYGDQHTVPPKSRGCDVAQHRADKMCATPCLHTPYSVAWTSSVL